MANVGYKSTSQFVSSGKWSHLVLTITNSNSNKDGYQFFYNGSRVYHGTFDWFKRDGRHEDVKIGHAGYQGGYLKGFIDDVRIYSKKLSNSEISLIYGGGAGDLNTHNLFSIDQNGTVRTKKSFDFESDAHSYELPIIAKVGTTSLQKQFSVSIDNVVEDLDADGIEDALDSDADGDGFSNVIEIANGSNPMDALSYNRAPTAVAASSALHVNENQPKGTIISTFSGTDTDAIFLRNGGIPCGLVSLPIRYMHTTVETTSLRDLAAISRIFYRFCRDLETNTNFVPTIA